MDMRSPGVEVRPIRQANGRSEFGELFLTDVRIPAENMIGAENNGWRVAQATLASERGVIAFEGAERQRYEVEAFYRQSLESDAAWLEFLDVVGEQRKLLPVWDTMTLASQLSLFQANMDTALRISVKPSSAAAGSAPAASH